MDRQPDGWTTSQSDMWSRSLQWQGATKNPLRFGYHFVPKPLRFEEETPKTFTISKMIDCIVVCWKFYRPKKGNKGVGHRKSSAVLTRKTFAWDGDHDIHEMEMPVLWSLTPRPWDLNYKYHTFSTGYSSYFAAFWKRRQVVLELQWFHEQRDLCFTPTIPWMPPPSSNQGRTKVKPPGIKMSNPTDVPSPTSHWCAVATLVHGDCGSEVHWPLGPNL